MNRKIVSACIVILLIVAGAYAAENVVKTVGVKSGGIIKVSRNGKVAAYISDEVLKKLMENANQEEELSKGPTLLSAVRAAGIDSFNQIEIRGTGLGNAVTLKRKDMDESLILSISGNGKVDLTGKGSKNPIVENVNEINVS